MIKEVKVKAFILTNSLESGGAEKQSIMLANALQAGYETMLVVYYGCQLDPKLKDLAERYKINLLKLKGNHFTKIFKLFWLFRSSRPVFIFSFLATTNVLNAVIGRLAGATYRIGGIRNEKLSPKKMHLQKFLHNHLLTCSVFNNYRGKETLCTKGFREDKAFVIHNCIEVSRLPKVHSKQITDFKILSVGRFVEQKDHFTAINTFSQLLKIIKKKNAEFSVKYTIVGYGILEREIRDHIRQNELEGLIEIVINPLDIDNYYSNADLFLSTSRYEGLSNTIMEAMAHSLPVVATNVGDNKYMVRDGDNGYLREVGAADDLAQAQYHILSDFELRKKMSENSYTQILNHFSLEIFKKKYLSLMNKLSDEF